MEENTSKKIYLREEAEKVLPEIKSIVRNIKTKSREYSECLIKATKLVISFRENPRDTDGVLDKTIKTREELKSFFKQLEKYGVILRDLEYGTVDFPTEIGGVEGFLCWRALEESEISWWHRKEEECRMRKPLKKNSAE